MLGGVERWAARTQSRQDSLIERWTREQREREPEMMYEEFRSNEMQKWSHRWWFMVMLAMLLCLFFLISTVAYFYLSATVDFHPDSVLLRPEWVNDDGEAGERARSEISLVDSEFVHVFVPCVFPSLRKSFVMEEFTDYCKSSTPADPSSWQPYTTPLHSVRSHLQPRSTSHGRCPTGYACPGRDTKDAAQGGSGVTYCIHEEMQCEVAGCVRALESSITSFISTEEGEVVGVHVGASLPPKETIEQLQVLLILVALLDVLAACFFLASATIPRIAFMWAHSRCAIFLVMLLICFAFPAINWLPEYLFLSFGSESNSPETAQLLSRHSCLDDAGTNYMHQVHIYTAAQAIPTGLLFAIALSLPFGVVVCMSQSKVCAR